VPQAATAASVVLYVTV